MTASLALAAAELDAAGRVERLPEVRAVALVACAMCLAAGAAAVAAGTRRQVRVALGVVAALVLVAALLTVAFVVESWRYADTPRREVAFAAALVAAALWVAAAWRALRAQADVPGRPGRAVLALVLPVLLCVDRWLVAVLNTRINPG